MDCTDEEEKRAILITIKVRLDTINVVLGLYNNLHMTYPQMVDFLNWTKKDLETKLELIHNGEWTKVRDSLSNRIDSAKEEIKPIEKPKKGWFGK